MESKKHTPRHNKLVNIIKKRQSRTTDVENKPVRREGQYGGEEGEVQTIRCKTCYKAILYNMGNRANICKNSWRRITLKTCIKICQCICSFRDFTNCKYFKEIIFYFHLEYFYLIILKPVIINNVLNKYHDQKIKSVCIFHRREY